MPASPGLRTVVIGGGVVGLGVAWRLAQRGVDVTVVDHAPGRGASWAAAGMLAPVTEAHFGEEALLALNLASQARWPEFASELADASGRDPGYRETGTVVAARDRDDKAALDRLATFQTDLGLVVERLTSRELRRFEPGLAPTVVGGLFVAGDHQVDNRALVDALHGAAERSGARFERTAAVAVRSHAGQVRGVETGDGRVIDADVVVLAAGWASTAIEGVPGDAVPVRPVKGQLLHLAGPAEFVPTTRTVRGVDVYVVARGDGRIVVGATVEERGDDTTVTAGGVLDLLRDAYELLPGIAELELVETTAGLRPGTPDNAPLLGRGPLDGLVIATGHYRNGILLCPVTADAIAEVVTGAGTPDVIAPFSPLRFAPQEATR